MDQLVSKKRKNIKRERRLVEEAGISVRMLPGNAVSEAEWHTFYRFYCNTFHERGRFPFLTETFFPEIAAVMGEQLLLVMAAKGNKDVAGAISFKSASALFGRHWGCHADFDSLHFECCYYQGIDYCIQHGLQRFEPGVQGEHKIWRGFLPTITRSAHWLAHPAFSEAIGDFLRRETPSVRAYAQQLQQHSPYRQDA
jgi:predicted N-acyltransferase